MRKILAFFRVGSQMTLAYRAENLVWFLLEFAGLVPMVSLWFYLGRQGLMNSSTVGYLVTYYFLTIVVSRLTASNFEDWVINDIRDGNISSMLLKPFSYSTYLFVHETTWRFFGLIYLVPTIVLLWLILGPSLFASINFNLLVPVSLLLVVSFLQRLWLSWLIAITSFWIQESKSLTHLKWMLAGTLGGAWLPLTFFPVWFQSVAHFSPFYYWYSFPIDLLTGKAPISSFPSSLTIHVIWLVILAWFGQRMWAAATKKYSAVGN